MTEAMDSESEFEEYAAKNPLKRVGLSQDIADAVLFLASDGADFINGENVHVSGGILLV
jgi:3-oxoacyl-[acyl-carrier protein] reductase